MIRNNSTGMLYIGQSCNLRKRIKEHFRRLSKNEHHNKHLQRAYNKYGHNAFSAEVIELCDRNELDDKEIGYIKQYNSFDNGYNLTVGGEGCNGMVLSDETRAKMREHHYDCSGANNPMYGKSVKNFMSDEAIERWKSNISEAHKKNGTYWKGKHLPDAVKKKLSIAHLGKLSGANHPMFGKKRSINDIEKITISLRYFYDHNTGENNARAHKVVCLNTGESFGCIKDAAEKYNISYTAIVQCCSLKHQYAGEYNGEHLVWIYEECYKSLSKEDISERIKNANTKNTGERSSRSKKVVCVNTGDVYASCMEAATSLGLDHSTICKVCRGKNKSCGKDQITMEPLRWMFYDDYINMTNNSPT